MIYCWALESMRSKAVVSLLKGNRIAIAIPQSIMSLPGRFGVFFFAGLSPPLSILVEKSLPPLGNASCP